MTKAFAVTLSMLLAFASQGVAQEYKSTEQLLKEYDNIGKAPTVDPAQEAVKRLAPLGVNPATIANQIKSPALDFILYSGQPGAHRAEPVPARLKAEFPNQAYDLYGEGYAYIHLGRTVTESEVRDLYSAITSFDQYPQMLGREKEIIFYRAWSIDHAGKPSRPPELPMSKSLQGTLVPGTVAIDLQAVVPVVPKPRLFPKRPEDLTQADYITQTYVSRLTVTEQSGILKIDLRNKDNVGFLIPGVIGAQVQKDGIVVKVEAYPYAHGWILYAAAAGRAEGPSKSEIVTIDTFRKYITGPADFLEQRLR